MSSIIILNKNFVWGPYGEDWKNYPWPSLRISSGLGDCAYVSIGGINAPALQCKNG